VGALGDQATANFKERLLARRVQCEVVEASPREDWLPRGRVDPIDLEGMENGVGTNLDEGVAAPWRVILGAVEGHACVEDSFVERNQPVHVTGQQSHVM
jgi:hypothetical protein